MKKCVKQNHELKPQVEAYNVFAGVRRNAYENVEATENHAPKPNDMAVYCMSYAQGTV